MSEASACLGEQRVNVPGPSLLHQAPMRVVRWLRARAFAFAPEQLGLAEGLRAATVVALMVLITYATGDAMFTWAAFAAFWTCLSDPGGGDRVRLRAMASFVLLAPPIAFLFTYLAGFGVAATAAALFVVVGLCNLSGRLGAELAQPGLLASVVAVVAAEQPQALPDALRIAGVALIGGIAALTICLAVWRIHPHQNARRAAAAAFRDLYELTVERRGSPFAALTVPSQLEADHRRAVRAAIEQARGAVDRISAQFGDSAAARALATAITACDQIFAGLIALSTEAGDERLDAALAALQAALLEGRRQALSSNPAWERLQPYADRLTGLAAAEDDLPARAISLWSGALSSLCAPPASLPFQRTAARSAAPSLSPETKRAMLRHALRLATVVTATYLAAKLLNLSYAYWATMAAIVVMRPQADAAWPRMLERIAGSVLGGFIAAGLAASVGATWQLMILVFPLAAATIALRSVNYTLFVLFLTPLFVLVADLVAPGHGQGVALARAANNMFGSAMAFAGCALLWPERSPASFRTQLADAVAANLRFAALAIDPNASPAEVEAARRMAGLRSTAAEEALQRQTLAGRKRQARLDEANAILARLRRVASYATAKSLVRGSRSGLAKEAFRQCYATLATALPDYVCHGGRPPFGALAWDGDAASLDAAVIDVAYACERYVRA
ncbi:MAG: FUSC family protein [Pseudomonadota bacterium]|jgi:hypothetical protein